MPMSLSQVPRCTCHGSRWPAIALARLTDTVVLPSATTALNDPVIPEPPRGLSDPLQSSPVFVGDSMSTSTAPVASFACVRTQPTTAKAAIVRIMRRINAPRVPGRTSCVYAGRRPGNRQFVRQFLLPSSGFAVSPDGPRRDGRHKRAYELRRARGRPGEGLIEPGRDIGGDAIPPRFPDQEVRIARIHSKRRFVLSRDPSLDAGRNRDVLSTGHNQHGGGHTFLVDRDP